MHKLSTVRQIAGNVLSSIHQNQSLGNHIFMDTWAALGGAALGLAGDQAAVAASRLYDLVTYAHTVPMPTLLETGIDPATPLYTAAVIGTVAVAGLAGGWRAHIAEQEQGTSAETLQSPEPDHLSPMPDDSSSPQVSAEA